MDNGQKKINPWENDRRMIGLGFDGFAIDKYYKGTNEHHSDAYQVTLGMKQSLGGHGAGTKSVWDLNNFCPLSWARQETRPPVVLPEGNKLYLEISSSFDTLYV